MKENADPWATGVSNAVRKSSDEWGPSPKIKSRKLKIKPSWNGFDPKVAFPSSKKSMKYGSAEFEIRDNFSYWNVSRFRLDFELKFR
jgi:hypothetical protein